MPTNFGEGNLLYLSLGIQILISSGNTLRDTPRNNDFPAIWASLSLVKLTYKINYLKGGLGLSYIICLCSPVLVGISLSVEGLNRTKSLSRGKPLSLPDCL